jgi:amino acid adenylation domain-containing protein
MLLQDLLRSSAERSPEREAVNDGVTSMTYGQLDARSNQLANLLRDLGVFAGDRVGLYLDKSVDAVVGVYGVLKTGAAYVPLDPRSPTSRLAYIAADCDLQVLVSGEEKSEEWERLVGDGAPVRAIVVPNGDPELDGGIEVRTSRDVDQQDDTAPITKEIDLDLAYILYTSGSTGTPKGVMLSHSNALTFVRWAVERFDVSETDRLSNHAPFHFDLSVFDLFAASAAGAAVVLVPPELSAFPVLIRDLIEEKHLTIWYSVPSMLTLLALRGGLDERALPDLRTILFAGEVFPTKYLRRLMTLLPHVEFFNLYGPTETNVCTYYFVETPPDGSEPIPIGAPIDNVEVVAMNDDGSPAADGDVGELYVRGTTVMQGYWGDEQRSGRALPTGALGRGLRDPAYRTGDLVRRDAIGNFHLLGRRDHQIKSRGYRIELGEIESALYAHPSVQECAVVAVPDPLVTNRIRAYVVTSADVEVGELLRHCADRIPQYMLPDDIEFRAALPRTSTGKVDRQALVPA